MNKILQYVISILLSQLDEETLKRFAAIVLTFIEDTVLASETKLDDRLLLPLCDMIRSAFNINPQIEEG